MKTMKGLIRWVCSLQLRMVAFVMQHLEEIVKWYFFLADDVISTYGVDEFKQMIIIPFYSEKSSDIHYDFYV